ncbi:endonuclease/exonuclease/phosphatase family protein [Carboxylicivirga taeanensis]|uniref:endonuclease/exonuclease/phosphatase family protein n=1 Tax=Carboxylicivirga taeanensis TaxID=1416875 RepID=UPI003F6E39F5
MTIRSLIILCVVTIGGFLYFCTETDRSLKVMSFNVRYDNPSDGANAWSNRKTMVFDFIKKQQPDIIGFQEVLKHQLDQLQDNLADYGHVGAGRNDGKEAGEYVPVFYLKEKYELLASSHFWLSETPEKAGSKSWGAALPRIVTWLQLKERSNGYIFYVFNTHFSHVSDYARNESAILLLNKIKTIAGEAPVVLSGDFNAEPSERMYTTLTSNWTNYWQLWDSRTLAVNNANKDFHTFNGFSEETPKIIIDHIFVNGYFHVLDFETFHVVKEDMYISDHYPIMAHLSFRMNKKEAQGEAKKLMQNALPPTIEFDQFCFFDSTVINIKPQGQNATIFYTLNQQQPDSTAFIYRKPITLKESGSVMARAYVGDMYPSPVTTASLVKRKHTSARLQEVVPDADPKYYSEKYTALFDNKHGNMAKLDNGSWCGFNGTDNDFILDFDKPTDLDEVYISCLSQPSMWIVAPSKVEIKTSNDGINYKKATGWEQQPLFEESNYRRLLIRVPLKVRARYVKVSVYNGGVLPPSHSGSGNPSWTFIDELVVQ